MRCEVADTFSEGRRLERVWGPRTSVPWCPSATVRPARRLQERCRRQRTCLFCARKRITSLSAAIEWVEPTHLMTVGPLGLDWDLNRYRLGKLLRVLRKARNLESFTVLEAYATIPGVHAHVLLHGDVPSLDDLSELSARAGIAFPHLKSLDSEQANASYFLKVPAWTDASLASHHQLNGMRLFHASRGFWADPVTGETLKSSQAERRARGFFSLGTGLTPLELWRIRHVHAQSASVARKAG